MKAQTKPYVLRLLWLLLFPLTWLSTVFAQHHPALTEKVYSAFLFPIISKLLPMQYLPTFSFLEILILVGPFVLLTGLIYFVVRLIRDKTGRLRWILQTTQKVLIVFGLCYFLFYFLWGYNYYRQPYSVIAGWPDSLSTKEELYALCGDLIRETNAARGALPSHEDGSLAYDPTVTELQEKGRLAYAKARKDNIAGITGITGYAKPIALSRLMSYTGITGVYFPYTGEANFNNDIPSLYKGQTLCHEIAHRQGFAREDEAEFIAVVVCANSEDAYLRYSGSFSALTSAMNRLRTVDPDAYLELYGLYSPEVLADIEDLRAYWHLFEGAITELSTQINDSYLKTHNLSDGVQSYGRMVDLMLAQKRAHTSLTSS
ncbi:MAG: DUF3810 domain-containing protein [Peptococcaceae bacterium]|nr:DUF3810 domain-containing protein [Peptococcaceae bacterium]